MDTLILHYSIESQEDDSRVGLVSILRRNDGRLAFGRTYPELCGLKELLHLSVQLIGNLSAATDALGTPVNFSAAAGIIGDLPPLSRRLADLILPSEIAGVLGDRDRVRHVIFCYDPRLNAVPFEWLWLGDDFACFRVAAGRELLSSETAGSGPPTRKSRLPISARLMIVPPPELTADERRQVLDDAFELYSEWSCSERSKAVELDSLNLSGSFTRDEVLEAMLTREIVCLYCHHHYDAGAPERSGFHLSPEAVLTAQHMLAAFGPHTPAPVMIVSFSCESALTHGWEKDWPNSQRLYGMVDAAKRLRVPLYLGAMIKIPALKTIGALRHLLTPLASGHTVGEVVRRARVSLREDRQNPTDGATAIGLALTLYGDPSIALISGSGRRTAEVHAPVCEARLGQDACGKAVAPEDLGFALRLCPEHHSPEGCSAGHPHSPGTPLKQCRKCDNKLCSKCSGWGQQLCWEHCCFGKHEIVGKYYVCSDPHQLHPNEKRSVCSEDPGWIRHLCRDCLSRISR